MKTLILLLLTSTCFGQLHLTGGFTNIEDRTDGNTINFNVGYSQEISFFRLRASYGKVSVPGLNYDNISSHVLYKLNDTKYRLELGAGATWNDVDYNIDPSILLRNALKVDNGLYVTVDFEHIIKKPSISHLSIGFLIDVNWGAKLNKPRFF